MQRDTEFGNGTELRNEYQQHHLFLRNERYGINGLELFDLCQSFLSKH